MLFDAEVFGEHWIRTSMFTIKSATDTHRSCIMTGRSNHFLSCNEWEQDNPPQSSSPSLFVQEAVSSASNHRLNLASWHCQFTDRLDPFVCSHGFFSFLKVLAPSPSLCGIPLSGECNLPVLLNCYFVDFTYFCDSIVVSFFSFVGEHCVIALQPRNSDTVFRYLSVWLS